MDAAIESLKNQSSPAEPLLLRGAVRGWPACSWSFRDLSARTAGVVVPVHTGSWEKAAFRVRREGATVRMDAGEFLANLADGRGNTDGYMAGPELLRKVPDLRKDLGFPYRGPLSVDVVWIGAKGLKTPLHLDFATNYYAQLQGEKRWRLWKPKRALKPRFSGLGAFAMSALDAGAGLGSVEKPDLDLVVSPGDLLVLPTGWWHHVETLSDSIAVNRWWRFDALGRLFARRGS